MMAFAGVVLLERMPRDLCLGSDSRSKGILDLVNSDLCGPMTVASLSGCYVIFRLGF
jgi:hypothetical protein